MVFLWRAKKRRKEMAKLNKYPLTYPGNKFNETKEIISEIKQYDIIAEPFGGIFGFSRYIFHGQPSHCKFLINDIDGNLIALHEKIQTCDPLQWQKDLFKLFDEIKDMTDTAARKEAVTRAKTQPEWREFMTIAGDIYIKWRERAASKIKNIEYIGTLRKILDRCEFFNMDAFDFVELVNQREGRKLIYFDPPYFDSSNKSYCFDAMEINNKQLIHLDNTAIYIKILNILKAPPENTQILLVIALNVIMDYIFSPFEKKRYAKIYGMTHTSKSGEKLKRHIIHIIYGN